MMKRKRFIRASLLTLIMVLAVMCQEEKFTEKGFPEVEVTAVKLIEGGGAVFEGRILSTGSDDISEHGFLWDTNDNPLPGTAEKALLGPRQGSGAFTCTVMADIEEDQLYYIRAFVVTENYLSLGSVTTFEGGGSQPPELISVTPASAVCGDTVIISGRNFSFTPANNKVFFDGTEARVIIAASDEMRVIVPLAKELPIKIDVTVSGLGSANKLDFAIKQPTLSSFSPLTGTFNDIVTLSGSNFSLDTSCARVYFNNVRAEITGWSRTHYTVRVPPENTISPAVIKVKYFSYFSYNEQFTLKQAVISGVSPVLAKTSDIIVITGENFNPSPRLNIVMVGGEEAYVVSSSASEIAFKVPHRLDAGSYSLTLATLQGLPVTWPGTIELVSPWKRLNDFPGTARSSPAVFATGTHGYVGTGHNVTELNDFWRYTPATDQWSPVMNFPISRLDFASGFAIDGTGYVTLGKVDENYNKALARYTTSSDTWNIISNKPGSGSSMKSPVFVINGKAYVPAAGEMYEYDPSTNAWTKKAYPADLQYFGSGVAFSIGNKGYMGIGWVHQLGTVTTRLYEYDPVGDRWTRKADFPGTPRSNTVFFTLPNGKAYVGLGTTTANVYLNDMWEFDPVANSWARITDFPGTARYSAIAFSVGSKAYIGFGYDGQHRNDLWEFNPGEGK